MKETLEAAKTFGLSDAFGMSILGFAIVFFVLIVLMCVIKILRGIVERMEAPKAAPAAAPASSAPSTAGMVPAKGSLGEIKLHDVDDKTAAIIMAIVADTLQAPLNELRFLSIREKK